jgi:hypothetical protein
MDFKKNMSIKGLSLFIPLYFNNTCFAILFIDSICQLVDKADESVDSFFESLIGAITLLLK